ncbi:MAG: chemotaxis protein CheW [Gemmatimonadaceae bacterium]
MTAPAPAPAPTGVAGKFLTFVLAGEEYGVDALKVQEIIRMQPITRVPRTPEFIRGVINLRGKMIPVIDLRCKFDMPVADEEGLCIIVLRVTGILIGIVVDQVADVRNIAAGDIEPPPPFGTDVDTGFLLGLAKTDGRVRFLLDIDRVLTETQLGDVAVIAELSETADPAGPADPD